jgi:hypothetical protein
MALQDDDGRCSVRGLRARGQRSPSAKIELPNIDAMTTPIAVSERDRAIPDGLPSTTDNGSSAFVRIAGHISGQQNPSGDRSPNRSWCFWAPIVAEIARIGAQIDWQFGAGPELFGCGDDVGGR